MKTVVSRIPKCTHHKDIAIFLPLRFYVKLICLSYHFNSFCRNFVRMRESFKNDASLKKYREINLQNDLTVGDGKKDFTKFFP